MTDQNTSAHKFWDPKENKIYITNHLKSNEEQLALNQASAQLAGTEVPNLFEMPETELFKYDPCMVTNCLLNEDDV